MSEQQSKKQKIESSSSSNTTHFFFTAGKESGRYYSFSAASTPKSKEILNAFEYYYREGLHDSMENIICYLVARSNGVDKKEADLELSDSDVRRLDIRWFGCIENVGTWSKLEHDPFGSRANQNWSSLQKIYRLDSYP